MNEIIIISIIIVLFIIIYYLFYTPPFIYANQLHINEIYNLLKNVDCVFNKTNTQYTMVGGTLLGSVRHNGLIPWDNDADIAVLNKSFTEILEILKPLERYNIRSYLNKYKGIVKVHFLNSAIVLDIFVFNNISNVFQFAPPYNTIYKNEFFTKNELYPLKKYKFGPLKLYGPNNAINYLNRAYPNWNDTAVTWVFDWDSIINKKNKNKHLDLKSPAIPDFKMSDKCNI